MMDTLKRFVGKLLEVTPGVYHDEAAPDHPDQYIVWSIDNGDTLWGDGIALSFSLSIVVDLFTTLEFDPMVDQLQACFGANRLSWRLESVQYERDTGLTHWEWVIDLGEADC